MRWLCVSGIIVNAYVFQFGALWGPFKGDFKGSWLSLVMMALWTVMLYRQVRSKNRG